MTTTDQAKISALHFPYSSIQFIADANQCQQLTDESIKYLTLETTGVIRFLLQVKRELENERIFFFGFFRMHLNLRENVDEQK
jgi:hypothetical protein